MARFDSNDLDETEKIEDETPAEGSPEGSLLEIGDPAEYAKLIEERDQEIQNLQEKVKALNDQLLRAMADLENVRRRSRQDREEAAQFGLQDFLTDFLPVADNFERALASGNATVESLQKGVEVTLRQIHDVLRKHGVEPVPGPGEPFDAKHHEAIMRAEPTEEFPAGTVAEELRKGYTLRGRLVRPSLVKVAQEE
jgi:molecular chaperone GrpE